MARSSRSLQASTAGLEKAKTAFKLKGWTQDYLAGSVGCSRPTINNFFARRPVDKGIFQTICTELGLDWGEIAELEPGEEQAGKVLSIDELVQTARENIRDSIYERCATMRVLDMTQPIGLDDIYTSVNILEKITGRRRLEIAELLKNFSLENFERFSLSDVREKRVPGLEAVKKYSKLMILGKPGAGKTTFLKHLALQCIEGKFQPKHIPLFITLKDFAEAQNQPSLLKYLIQLFTSYNIAPNTQINTGWLESLVNLGLNNANQSVDLTAVEKLLNQGKLLILLDGLDEVREADSKRVLDQIRDFTTQFRKNQFVITCRIAAREYTFEQFSEVEIADFDNQQINSFAKKWFKAKDDTVKAERFIEKLKEDEPIQELATSPLLLTLLCLVFEDNGNFPANRSELYKEGLDVLLKKWDTKRNIEREQVYKKLSLKRKEDLLSQIAHLTFERGEYFIKQKDIEKYIAQYIQNLPEVSTDPEALQLDSEGVLKSIEAQHGLFIERARSIYSFSHLTFHEYFTARKIVTSSNPYELDDKTLQALAIHIPEKRWREVFLLTVGMLESADSVLQLMKQQIDALLATDEKLQQFLAWVGLKSSSVAAPYKPAAIRAFYLARFRDRDRFRDSALTLALAFDGDRDRFLDRFRDRFRDLDLALNRAFDLAFALDRDLARDRFLDLDLALDLALTLTLDHDHDHDLARDGDGDGDRSLSVVINHTLAFDRDRDLARSLSVVINHALAFDRDRTLTLDLAFDRTLTLDLAFDRARFPELQLMLQELKKQLSDISTKNWENTKRWWQANGQAWTEQLKNVMIEHRNIGHDWQFNDNQRQLLRQYYDANKLLVDCLNSECYVSRSVRQQIEDTLLLPVNRT
ncbi:NACHT domain-containing protein [Nostoc sp. 'Peltigera membranacea cyanobiont' N6]|uniref:NACHT domain-containing protein n=1 Tax=Nostoc sp. 'Peltigera membranacea cyanobiont' N6 TaxID=1261031 RepID=UPI000CF36077|nr:NACHT domain-containing NTPase [Nostoc sp. 'Peltigera membranacea cyanobiont' N6]AVH68449.1 signal transduction protein with NACHT domain [Nostoc sp. 'Peltigera membranacea cyanobiont' N6]